MGYTKVIQSGDLTEIYEYERNLPVIKRKTRVAQRDSTGKRSDRRFSSRNPADIRRSRKKFVRIVRANLRGNERPALLTFTMLQELSLRTSVRLFTKFIDRLRKRYGTEFRYIAVPEFQKRGAVHFHVLMWGLGHLCEKERTTRHFARLWACGFVDSHPTDGSPKLAGYLGKYMSKCMRDLRLRGEKAYYTSRNALRPLSYGSGSLHSYLEYVIPSFPPSHQHEFDTEWLGRCIYKSYDKQRHENDIARADRADEQER